MKLQVVPPTGVMLLTLLAGCAQPGAPPAETADPQPVVLALERYVGRLVTITGRINGDSLRLLFDTGGGATLIGPHVAASIECEPSGRHVGHRMSGERVEWPLCPQVPLDFMGHGVTAEDVGVWDLAALLPEGLPRLDGLVSLETFEDRPLTLRLSEATLTLETPASFEEQIRSMVAVPSRRATGNDGTSLTVHVFGQVEGVGAWLLMDSANLAETLLAPHVPTGPEPGNATITFADSVSVQGAVSTRDIIYDGALSEAFLRRMVVTIDPRDGRVWVAPAL